MLGIPRHYVPDATATCTEFASSKSPQNGRPSRTQGGSTSIALTGSPLPRQLLSDASPSRYSPYPRRRARSKRTPSPTLTHNHLSSSSESSTLCSCRSGSVCLSTTNRQSKLLCGVHTSAELPLYKSRADLCLPQIQARILNYFSRSRSTCQHT